LADPTLLLEAHHVQWGTQASTGNFRKALAHTEEGIARYDSNEHHRLTFVYGGHDTGVCARNVNAVMLCVLGYPEQAQQRSQAALALARELAHPLTLEIGYLFALIIGLLVRDVSKVEQHTSDFAELVRGGKLPKEASGIAEGFRGWMLAEGGAVEHGLAVMRCSREYWRLYTAWSFPLDASMAALLSKAGHANEGLQLVGQALQAAEDGGAHWYNSEFHRVRAGLYQAMDPAERLQMEN